KENDGPMPRAGTTRPIWPLPMNGDGVRPGSSVERRKLLSRSTLGVRWACNGEISRAEALQTQAGSKRRFILNPIAEDGGSNAGPAAKECVSQLQLRALLVAAAEGLRDR